MSLIPRFVEYAGAFEKAFETDNWSLVAPYFSESATYDPGSENFGGLQSGREAILAYFDSILNGFDRRFASRELDLLEGPVEEGDSVWILGAAIYRAENTPELRLELKETLVYQDGQIVSLRDEYTDEMLQTLVDFIDQHRDHLGFTI